MTEGPTPRDPRDEPPREPLGGPEAPVDQPPRTTARPTRRPAPRTPPLGVAGHPPPATASAAAQGGDQGWRPRARLPAAALRPPPAAASPAAGTGSSPATSSRATSSGPAKQPSSPVGSIRARRQRHGRERRLRALVCPHLDHRPDLLPGRQAPRGPLPRHAVDRLRGALDPGRGRPARAFRAPSCPLGLVLFAFLIGWVVLMIQGFQGKHFKLPVIGDFAEQQAGRPGL